MSATTRQVLAVAAAAVVLGTVVALIYWLDRDSERGLREQQGRHRIDVALEVVSRETRAVQSDLLYLAEQPSLVRFLDAVPADGHPPGRREVTDNFQRFALRKGVYDQIRFLDESGHERIRVNYVAGRVDVVPPDRLQRKDDRYYFQQGLALNRGEVLVSDFDLNIERGAIERPLKPVLRFVTPVFDSAGRRGGLLVLNYLGAQLLTQLDSVLLPGSTLLINAEGQYLLGPTPDDAWGWMLGHERTFDRQFPAAWAAIRDRDEQQLLTDQGLFVTRIVRLTPVAADPRLAAAAGTSVDSRAIDHRRARSLILVSYLPRDEVFAESTKLLGRLSLIAAGAMVVVIVLANYWARAAVDRERQARRIADSESRLRRLSAQLLTAHEVERRTISRELHDELGQLVTAISLDLQSAAQQPLADSTRALLARAVRETEQLLHSLHEIASRVRPAILDDLGLRDAIESYCRDFQDRTGIAVERNLDFAPDAIPPVVGENVYRILQEALTNVAKHAQATRVAVRAIVDEDVLRASVEDDGIGFEADQPSNSRLGLLGVRERVELLDGQFRLTTAVGQGTAIHIDLPLRHTIS